MNIFGKLWHRGQRFSLGLTILLLFSAFGLPTTHQAPALKAQVGQIDLSFVSEGHILGFTQQGVYAATGNHALRVEFIGANPTRPRADLTAASGDSTAPLSRVVYEDLWNRIQLTYIAAEGSIYETTYTLLPGAQADDIRLRYNAPLKLDNNGKLTIFFENGSFSESAPVAWQEIQGARVPVEVAFRVRDREVGFSLGNYNPHQALYIDPSLVWNTFLGGSSLDYGEAIAIDSSGNSYVVGTSGATWGSPIRSFSGSGNLDAFVAKLDSSGVLVWHTFLGSTSEDLGWSILFDSSSNSIYAMGNSTGSWGSPVRSYTAGRDTFVARLDSSGSLTALTFLGGSGADYGKGISRDSYSNLYVTGNSNATWGTPQRAYTASVDGYVAKLSPVLALSWNTFLGGSGLDRGRDIDVLSNYAIYVAGESDATWGSPVRSHAGDNDGFVALVNENGSLTWNTFLGSGGVDVCNGIVVANVSSVYVTGLTSATWGSPVRAFIGSGNHTDAFAAKLNSSGSLIWNTFLGGSGEDYGNDLTIDDSGNLYIAGESDAGWGSPLQDYASNGDAFVAKLNSAGSLLANTFMGGNGLDSGNDLAVDSDRNVYLIGKSNAAWGSPVRAYSTGDDAFVAKVDFELPTIQWISLNSPNPTSAANVQFRIQFSERVTDVGNNDFGLYTTGGILGASILNHSQVLMDNSVLVTVNTGTGDGTIQLRVMGWADIYDLADNPLTGLPYLSGPAYTVNKSSPTVSVYLPLILR